MSPKKTHMVNSRILKGMMANGFSQVVNAAIQLLGLPVFLRIWGIELYGEWLMLSALAAYFTLGDLGFVSVAANDMTMHMAKGDTDKATAVFQSALAVVCLASGLILLAVSALAAVQSHWPILPLHHIDATDTSLILFTLGLMVALDFFAGLAMAGLRARGSYALGIFGNNLGRLAEFLATLSGVVAGATPLQAIMIMLAMRVLSTVCMVLLMRKIVPGLSIGYAHASKAEIRLLLGPSIAFMGFPLGNALGLQGITLLIGIVLNPAAVVVFTALRTLTRLVTQSLAIVNHSIWPEISIAYGEQNDALVSSLHQRSVQYSLWIALCGAVSLAWTGGWIVQYWTRGAVKPDLILLGLLLLVMVANALWFGSFILQAATNRHAYIAGSYILSSAAVLALASQLAKPLGLHGVALALLAGELTMAFVVIRRSLTLLDLRARALTLAVLQPPRLKL
ncbi:lipopolysaccharide biosynthesis protein [Duganella sp. CT11-25]|uniref:lipopolysaccharide biosynthesis protein n=1 Tax=unclassified Duganella TaxID=2636909 RepID=UPI0039AFB331